MSLVVYLLTPTSNHNFCASFSAFSALYIFWLLHQTTTISKTDINCRSCISFDSYIKPQLLCLCTSLSRVVYLLTPTSNHNLLSFALAEPPVVYLLTPTSNHNALAFVIFLPIVVYLLTPTSNHNHLCVMLITLQLYIFWLLHQTTTSHWWGFAARLLYIFWLLHQTTTECCNNVLPYPLYIFWLLHQTTTDYFFL